MLKGALIVGEMMKIWVKGTWQSDVSLNPVVKGMGSRIGRGISLGSERNSISNQNATGKGELRAEEAFPSNAFCFLGETKDKVIG